MKPICQTLLVVLIFALLQSCASTPQADRPTTKDAQIIKQLKDAGKDINQARDIEFFLYFPQQTSAKIAANELAQEGYKIEVSKDDFKKMWLVLATGRVLPTEANMQVLRKKFENMTAQAGGKYLDWGTPMADGY